MIATVPPLSVEPMSFPHKYLNLAVILISLVTIISGLSQMVRPGLVLQVVGAESSPTASHFFAIVGLFMALFGGLMLHAVYSTRPQTAAILWSAFQKIGAFVAVTLGVIKGVFSFMALGVALFDLFSGLLFLYYLKQRRKQWPS